MTIEKALDRAIMLRETAANPNLKACYWVENRPYENYLSNESWAEFKADMEHNHHRAYIAYGLGGGKEMEERTVGKYTYPPKMASFGSSSRMIYNLMKSNPNFFYEKKLPTTIGGTANLDGFYETNEKSLFVEAKCREPYSHKNGEIADKYMNLYSFLTKSERNNITCKMTPSQKGKMVVQFFAGEKLLERFDIKQMICHLLGIATDCLQGICCKGTDFIYLLYNPSALHIENEEILRIYNQECRECESIDFNGLFYDILYFLAETENIGKTSYVEQIARSFSFIMCDQHTMTI